MNPLLFLRRGSIGWARPALRGPGANCKADFQRQPADRARKRPSYIYSSVLIKHRERRDESYPLLLLTVRGGRGHQPAGP